jgi:hypothetical protein
VPLPRTPFPALVVRFSFLWSHEREAGAREGRKDRPCVIVIAVRSEGGSRTRVRVVPITHQPKDQGRGVAVPPKVRRHLGLDDDASWISLEEANEFYWPGVDLRPVSRSKPGVWTYGVLPRELFAELQGVLAKVLDQRRIFRAE